MAVPTPVPQAPVGRHYWRVDDQRWAVARDWLSRTGYRSVSDLAEAIRVANYPMVVDWTRLDTGSVVLVPLGS